MTGERHVGPPSFGPYDVALTADEFSVWAQRVGQRQAAALRQRFGWRLLIVVAVAAAAVLAGFVAAGVLPAQAGLTAFLAMTGAAVLARLFFRRQIGRAQQAAIAALRGDREVWSQSRRIAFDDAGVAIETAGHRLTRDWRGAEAERLPGMLALWWSVAEGVALPLRALPEPGEADRLFAFATSRAAAPPGRAPQ